MKLFNELMKWGGKIEILLFLFVSNIYLFKIFEDVFGCVVYV